jgi:hypothetical protein
MHWTLGNERTKRWSRIVAKRRQQRNREVAVACFNILLCVRLKSYEWTSSRLFNESVSNRSGSPVSNGMDGWRRSMNLKAVRTQSWPTVRYYLRIRLVDCGNPRKNPSQNSRRPAETQTSHPTLREDRSVIPWSKLVDKKNLTENMYPQSSSTLWNYSKCGVYTVGSEAGC